jgi:sulfur-carrier protein
MSAKSSNGCAAGPAPASRATEPEPEPSLRRRGCNLRSLSRTPCSRTERRAVPVEVKLPTVLRAQADGQASLDVDGATVGEVFGELVERYPGLRGNLLDDAGGLHKFVNVYKDDDDIRYLEGLDTKLADGDVLSILPAVAGGT